METNTRVWPRKLARQMARAQLDKKGVTGYNKEPVIMGARARSHFARHWKELAVEARDEAIAREKARLPKALRKKARR